MPDSIYELMAKATELYRYGQKEKADKIMLEVSAKITQNNHAFWNE